ncbi:hypothetical protein B0J13DRAFT_227371 [Dactylonectria estremocensis]|uniref:Histidine kinase n=1 Tax=Dactylonectria estremocensis TaxID=1079267 RepID=A0A9P9JET5_9HYPO|nr:hypothetical protein B0J13DRAFT_227371 [Dactylonectria estremocensis]
MQQLRNDSSASHPDDARTSSASPKSYVAASDSTDPVAIVTSSSSPANLPVTIPAAAAVEVVAANTTATNATSTSTSNTSTNTNTTTAALEPSSSLTYEPPSTRPAPSWRRDNSQTNTASHVPVPNHPTLLPATTLSTNAIHQSSLYTAPSPRGLAQTPISSKRSSGGARGELNMHRSPVKKARTGTSPPRKVELPSTAAGLKISARAQLDSPVSPLFFSHTTSRHVNRPQGFPTAEVAASLLARMREDPSGSVTTLKMPRASVSAVAAARSESTPGSWGSSMDIPGNASSPESRSLPPGLQLLQGVGVVEFLEQDERPTFLIDLDNPANANRAGLHILYYNASLRGAHEVLQSLTADKEDVSSVTDFGRFKSWIMQVDTPQGLLDAGQASHAYAGVTWSFTTLRKRFRFVSGQGSFASVSPAPHSPEIPAIPDTEITDATDYFGTARNCSTDSGRPDVVMDQGETRHHPDNFTNQVLQSQPAKSIFDWTRIPITESLPEHIRFARSIDWASTQLGPIEDWSADLRAMSNLIMGSPHPAAMYWGPQFVCIYNAAYLELAGQKHPFLMGSCYSDAWSEIWTEVEPVFKSAWEGGQATMKHENQLFIDRHGFLEEAFFSWSIVPLVGGDGEVVGLYNPAFENTRRRVNERRMFMLREIGETTAAATTAGGFWPQVQKGLEYDEHDVPFALIYSVKDDTESEASSLHSGSMAHAPQLVLEGSIGVPDGHHAALTNLDLRYSDEGFAPHMRQCMTAGGVPIVLSREAGNLPSNLVEGVQWRGFGDASQTLVVLPVTPTTTGETVIGFIIMGVNPRRPYDEDYKLFIHLLSRQLANSMASVLLFEEEIKRGQKAARLAALDRQELSLQLFLRTQEAVESEYRFTRMAEFAPVGMFIASFAGQISYCNDMWWQISRHSREEDSMDTWMNSVRDEDRPHLEAEWNRLLKDKVTICVEFRFKCSQQSGDKTIDTWVLMSAYPEKTQDGSFKLIFGCITDISAQKWAEKVQTERREEAVELKRQQENFIDITSHEMRNPLSAILQCADQIANNISAFECHGDRQEVETLLDNCLDAANTINLCASHQKRIVDDILTLSKLDSNLLAVTPVDEQPVRVVQRALKMFEAELIAHDIEFDFQVDDSFEKHDVKWLKLDPSRLRQVLINLMTNAIKFTQGREKRKILVSLSASKDAADMTKKGLPYFDRIDHPRTAIVDIEKVDEWGSGEEIDLHCTVEDTGPGLLEEEVRLLFQRFQQATPRTHVQYGGSGLGLLISRILTEMQGGQIGVSSRRGVGSSFSFYIKARRSLNPPVDYEHVTPLKVSQKSLSTATLPRPEPTRQLSRTMPQDPAAQLYDVLIVEDNIVNQKVLQRQLRNCGNNTFVANHGKEALQTLQRSRFWLGKEAEGVDISVILMDLEMPVMDGVTCARKIRELEKEGTITKHIPIIAVTAYARPEQIANAKAAGIDDVISKPFRIPELIPKIEELVAKYKNLSVSTEA